MKIWGCFARGVVGSKREGRKSSKRLMEINAKKYCYWIKDIAMYRTPCHSETSAHTGRGNPHPNLTAPKPPAL